MHLLGPNLCYMTYLFLGAIGGIDARANEVQLVSHFFKFPYQLNG